MKVALVTCSDMHMDIENVNILLNHIMQNKDYDVTCDYTTSDIVIINTCAFGPKRLYSMRVIADVCSSCRACARIIVTGCLVKTNYKELSALPGIEVKTFDEVFSVFGATSSTPVRLVSQNNVIISTGCLKKCSYCVYPTIVDEYKSKSIEEVLGEVEKLYETESTIYITGAQETSDYGVDLYGKRSFVDLMERVVTKFPNSNYVIGWFHIAGLTDEVVSLIAKNKNITEIMLHIQHVNPEILKRMNRPTFEDMDRKIRTLRNLRPDLIISTEVIVGFPGETEEQFQELVEYLDKGYFNDIGVASYEPVKGTKAAELPNQVSAETKAARMELISEKFSATCYPAEEDASDLMISEYIATHNQLRRLPKNIFKAEKRQKYDFIAGTDTEEKLNFSYHFMSVVRMISSARGQLDFDRARECINSLYTDEAKAFFYEIIERGDFKGALKARARKLLLE